MENSSERSERTPYAWAARLPATEQPIAFDSIAPFLIYFPNIQFFVEGDFHKESEYSKEAAKWKNTQC